MKRVGIAVLLLALFAGAAVFGAEAPIAAPEVAAPAVEAAKSWDWIWGLEHLWKGIVLVGTTLLTWLFKKALDRGNLADAEKAALAAVEQGVIETYTEYVSALKEARKDGKLTKDEKKAARQMAYDKAMALAKGEGLSLLKVWGTPRVLALIEKIVAARKAKAN